ncbi:MAG: DUF6455 family protein [Pseudomonadota bacterium]
MRERLTDWLAGRQERAAATRASSAELMGNSVSLAAFMAAFDMPDDTRACMDGMAENFGLPANILETEPGRAMLMARTCGACGARGRCSRWLAGNEPSVAPDAFCPNADHWKELVRQYPATIPLNRITSED